MKRTGPGRPRVDDTDESVPVHLTLPARQYDEIYQRASAGRVSVQEQIRRDMQRASAQKKNSK
jgi:hypothetical protein